MRLIKYFLLVVFSILFLSPLQAEVVFPKATGFVNDYVGILTSTEIQQLNSITKALKVKNGSELAVVIVNTVEPLDPKLYAVKLFEKWKIGEKGKDNGVLLLLSMTERRIEIEVGYGLEGALPDALCGRILDTYAVPNFKAGKIGTGMVETAKAISQIAGGEDIPAAVGAEKSDNSVAVIFVVIIIVAILGMVFRKSSSVIAGIFGAVWGGAEGGWIGALLGGLIGFIIGFWGLGTFTSGRWS
ncbi:MAG: TPM domain-containing protein, partial [Candidatus Margulisiibacteriota bacterium]